MHVSAHRQKTKMGQYHACKKAIHVKEDLYTHERLQLCSTLKSPQSSGLRISSLGFSWAISYWTTYQQGRKITLLVLSWILTFNIFKCLHQRWWPEQFGHFSMNFIVSGFMSFLLRLSFNCIYYKTKKSYSY